jgi:thiosulfate reductase cytochrome b subunit
MIGFFGLLVSGIAILLAHPRLYWGETGNMGTPSILDLPLPFVLTGQTGWGRSLHFLSAWACVLNGLLYVVSGLLTRHFRKDLWPAGEAEPLAYNVPQRLTYLLVIAVLFPLMIWTGLAMSPAVTSVFPALVTGLGGQQSARTIHLFAAGSLVLFLIGHITMVWRAGFRNQVQAMITGKDRT